MLEDALESSIVTRSSISSMTSLTCSACESGRFRAPAEAGLRRGCSVAVPCVTVSGDSGTVASMCWPGAVDGGLIPPFAMKVATRSNQIKNIVGGAPTEMTAHNFAAAAQDPRVIAAWQVMSNASCVRGV